MPSIKMLKRLWTYHRKRTEASFRRFENSRKFPITNSITSHEHAFFPGHDPQVRSCGTITNSFCSESDRLTLLFTHY